MTSFMLIRTEIKSTMQPSSAGAIPDFRNYNYVRRPLTGLQPKEETYATLVVYPGVSGGIANSSTPSDTNTFMTSNFLLQSVQEQRQEKFQPLMTFGESYGFFFGEHPRIFQFQAVLLDTADFKWELEWWYNYENFFRGTKLVDAKSRVFLTYEDKVLEGYILSAGTGKNSTTPHEVQLNFSMWVTRLEFLSDPGNKEEFNKYDRGVSSGWVFFGTNAMQVTTDDVGSLAVEFYDNVHDYPVRADSALVTGATRTTQVEYSSEADAATIIFNRLVMTMGSNATYADTAREAASKSGDTATPVASNDSGSEQARAAVAAVAKQAVALQTAAMGAAEAEAAAKSLQIALSDDVSM